MADRGIAMKPPINKAVVTLAIGDLYARMGKSTHPLMKNYSEKVNADFIIINDPIISKATGLPAKYEKFQLYDILSRYQRVIFVDSDIVILPTTPDLFKLIDIDVFAAVSEESFSGAKLEKEVTQKELGSVEWSRPYFNSGVMVIPTSARELFNPNNPKLSYWAAGEFRKQHPTLLNDQPFLNHLVNKNKVEFYELPYKFNHTRAMPGSNDRFNSFMIHFSGASGHRYGERLDQIKLDSNVAKNPLLMKLSMKYPLYRWLADRLNMYFIFYLFKKMQRQK
jgi:lipopolysaccharide biosynthesis glycosyltransferase